MLIMSKTNSLTKHHEERCDAEISRLTHLAEELKSENDILTNEVLDLTEMNEQLMIDLEQQKSMRLFVTKQFKTLQAEKESLRLQVEQLQREKQEQSSDEIVEQIKLATKIQLRKSSQEKDQLVGILLRLQKELDELHDAKIVEYQKQWLENSLTSIDLELSDRDLEFNHDVELVWECDPQDKQVTSGMIRPPALPIFPSIEKPVPVQNKSFRNIRANRRKAAEAEEGQTVGTPYTLTSDQDEERPFTCYALNKDKSATQRPMLLGRFNTNTYRKRQWPSKYAVEEKPVDEDQWSSNHVAQDSVPEESVDEPTDDGKSQKQSAGLASAQDQDHKKLILTADLDCPLSPMSSLSSSSASASSCLSEETPFSSALVAAAAAAQLAKERERQYRIGQDLLLIGANLPGQVVQAVVPINVRRSRWGGKVFGRPPPSVTYQPRLQSTALPAK